MWVLPYGSVAALGRLPERLFLTGLDAHPQPPVHHELISGSSPAQALAVAVSRRTTGRP